MLISSPLEFCCSADLIFLLNIPLRMHTSRLQEAERNDLQLEKL